MLSVIVQSRHEADREIEAKRGIGYRVACVSGAGLPAGWLRITFVPASAFHEPMMEERP